MASSFSLRLSSSFLLAAVAFLLFLTQVHGQSKTVIAVSILPQKYFIERVAGDEVEVVVMIPPGASPESFEPSVAQMRSISQATVYFKIGHPKFSFEQQWLNYLLKQAGEIKVVDQFKGAKFVGGDPHIWLSPDNVLVAASNTAEVLSGLLPGKAKLFAANLAAFQKDIKQLDNDLQNILSASAAQQFIVFHPAWGYFAEQYGLRQVAIETDGKEPNLAVLGRMIVEAKKLGIKKVFVEPQHSPKSAKTVAQEIGARVVTIDPVSYNWDANLKFFAEELAAKK